MKLHIIILSLLLALTASPCIGYAKDKGNNMQLDYYGDTLIIPHHPSIDVAYGNSSTNATVQEFYDAMNTGNYQPMIQALISFKKEHSLDDWFYYQLIRKTAQAFSPKEANYARYTLYKWFLLAKSGYDANIAISDGQLIFYVRSEENIYDIPYYIRDGKHYVCLNIHDYANKTMDFEKDGIYPTGIVVPEGQKTFSYKVTRIPDLSDKLYAKKEIDFYYGDIAYSFKVMVNPQIQNIFANYPVVDFESYFNIPLSAKTYNSLIPKLKRLTKNMSQRNGVDYLMEFTRHAFLYKDDSANFGKEKRLSPEQTLMNEYSDCDDRAAFFFYLVKEIYNLPMIAMLYPKHITIAVQFNDPPANAIMYNGRKYAVCEPTSPLLAIGQIAPELKSESYEIAYAYDPNK